jgi:protein arginine kinase activator
MLCELCKQTQATVHLTEIVNEQMAELHLCEACANQKGAQVESHFGLSDLLSGLAEYGKTPETAEETTGRACASCGMTYEQFRKVGRLGCSECYPAFKRSLTGLLKRIHGAAIHVGKAPARLAKPAKSKPDLPELRRKLERAIEDEAFEEAAALRDQIHRIEHIEHEERPKPEHPKSEHPKPKK